MKDKREWDYSKLKGRITEKYGNFKNFSSDFKPLSSTSLGYKLNNQIEFKQTEIYTIINLLEIDENEIGLYFFTPKVEKTQ